MGLILQDWNLERKCQLIQAAYEALRSVTPYFTGADLRGWCEAAGFRSFEVLSLAGPGNAGVAYKERT